MPQIRPITDLRNTSEISDACHARRESLLLGVVAKAANLGLVVTPAGLDLHVQLQKNLRAKDALKIATDKAIADAEQEIAAGGQLLDAKEALGALRRKYFG